MRCAADVQLLTTSPGTALELNAKLQTTEARTVVQSALSLVCNLQFCLSITG